MKINKIGTGIATSGALLALTLIAGAQTTTATSSATASTTSPMVIEIGPGGRALLRGTITNISNGSLTVKSWGGNWTINIASSTKILPDDISNFQKEDFVGIQGKISNNSPWTINATLIKDWTYRKTTEKIEKENRKVVKEIIKNETPRNYQGRVSAVSGSGFTLTENNNAFFVNIASNAKILNKVYLPIAITDIRNGDNVRVWGPRSSSTITAQIVRNLSIPRTATSTN